MNVNCCRGDYYGREPRGASRPKEVKPGSEGSCVGGWVPRADSEKNYLSYQRGFGDIERKHYFDISDKGSGGWGKEKDGRASGARGGGGVLKRRTQAGSPLAPQRHNSLCSDSSSLRRGPTLNPIIPMYPTSVICFCNTLLDPFLSLAMICST